jgi:chemotaxis protein MotB
VAATRLGKKGGGGGEMESAGMMRWLLTYADMITLLLAFFIILFSISTINKVKLQRLVHDMGGGYNNVDAINNPPNGQVVAASKDDLQSMQDQMQQYIQQHKLQQNVQTQMTVVEEGKRRELVISLLTDKALYDSGKADIKPETRRILDQVDQMLRARQNQIRVEGFTDNVPIANAEFPSNWELSAIRATNVARYLIEDDGLQPQRISIAGYGEYRPRLPNDTEAHRQQNRRVDIVVVDTDAAAKAFQATQDAQAAGN